MPETNCCSVPQAGAATCELGDRPVLSVDTCPSCRQKGKAAEGIRLEIENATVSIELYVVAEPQAQMLQLGQTLQREISRAIHDVVGMPVKEIDIHIEDVVDRVVSASE